MCTEVGMLQHHKSRAVAVTMAVDIIISQNIQQMWNEDQNAPIYMRAYYANQRAWCNSCLEGLHTYQKVRDNSKNYLEK